MRNVVLFCDFNYRHIGTVADHLNAFKAYSRNLTFVTDARSAVKAGINLGLFDVLVVHYSVVISDAFLPEEVAEKIRAFGGYKVLFIQDEYRWVDATAAAVADLGIDVIYSVVNEDAVDWIYHHASIRHVRRKTTLTGYVPEKLTGRDVPAYEDRPIDVGYRARRLPGWLGRFAQEKWLIGERFKQDALTYGLVCDIEHQESKRLYGDEWIDFVSSCKAVLGTESGASFVDFTGQVQPAVEAFEAANPHAPFDEISERFLEGRDGDIVIRVISPRCFEAAALRTLMILYSGPYSGILEPWRHYVPLERDHSNMDEVVAVLRDPERARRIIENAYREIALNPRYGFRTMVEAFDRDLDENLPAPRSRRPAVDLVRLEKRIERVYRYRRRPAIQLRSIIFTSVHRVIETVIPESWRPSVVAMLRTFARRLGL